MLLEFLHQASHDVLLAKISDTIETKSELYYFYFYFLACIYCLLSHAVCQQLFCITALKMAAAGVYNCLCLPFRNS